MSEEKEEQEIETSKEDKGKKVSRAKYQAALEEILDAKKEAEKWKNSYYQAYADTQNLRKSLEEEAREVRRYRAEGLIDKLIPSIEAFRSALSVTPPNAETANYLVGFQYVLDSLMNALESDGVKTIIPKVGDSFDPATMHAVDKKEVEGMEENKIIAIQGAGYMLFDKLIRPAMVVVSTKEKPKEEN